MALLALIFVKNPMVHFSFIFDLSRS